MTTHHYSYRSLPSQYTDVDDPPALWTRDSVRTSSSVSKLRLLYLEVRPLKYRLQDRLWIPVCRPLFLTLNLSVRSFIFSRLKFGAKVLWCILDRVTRSRVRKVLSQRNTHLPVLTSEWCTPTRFLPLFCTFREPCPGPGGVYRIFCFLVTVVFVGIGVGGCLSCPRPQVLTAPVPKTRTLVVYLRY